MPEYKEVKDSGERQSFDSGAVRDTQEGKGRYDLLPTRALRRLAQHYENGAKKYGDNNYLLGMPMKRFADSALRHLFKAIEGQTDEDHFVGAIWNLMAIVEYQERIEEGILPKKLDNLTKLVEKESVSLFKVGDEIKIIKRERIDWEDGDEIDGLEDDKVYIVSEVNQAFYKPYLYVRNYSLAFHPDHAEHKEVKQSKLERKERENQS